MAGGCGKRTDPGANEQDTDHSDPQQGSEGFTFARQCARHGQTFVNRSFRPFHSIMADDPSKARRRVATPVTDRARKTPLASLPADLEGHPAPVASGMLSRMLDDGTRCRRGESRRLQRDCHEVHFSAIFGSFRGVCSVHLESVCVLSYSEMMEICVES